jgi:hypothetical protein
LKERKVDYGLNGWRDSTKLLQFVMPVGGFVGLGRGFFDKEEVEEVMRGFVADVYGFGADDDVV